MEIRACELQMVHAKLKIEHANCKLSTRQCQVEHANAVMTLMGHRSHHCIRMRYLTFRVLNLQFACSICSSHVLFFIPRGYLQFACSIFFLRVLFVLAFSLAARALDRVDRAHYFFSRVLVHMTLSTLTCMACWKQHGNPRGWGRC